MTEIAFIVGARIESIDRDVRHELGWKRTSLTTWEDLEGRKVHYLQDPHKLYGVSPDTIVYLAPGYELRDDWHKLDDAIRTRDLERVPL